MSLNVATLGIRVDTTGALRSIDALDARLKGLGATGDATALRGQSADDLTVGCRTAIHVHDRQEILSVLVDVPGPGKDVGVDNTPAPRQAADQDSQPTNWLRFRGGRQNLTDSVLSNA